MSVSGDTKSTVTGEVSGVSAVPLSYTEATSGIESDYAAYEPCIADRNLKAPIPDDSELTEGAINSAAITTQFLRPTGMLFLIAIHGSPKPLL